MGLFFYTVLILLAICFSLTDATISKDLRWRIIYLSELQGWSKAEIAHTLYLSESSVARIRSNFKNFGTVFEPNSKRNGRSRRSLSDEDLLCLQQMLESNPLMYLNEMREGLVFLNRRRFSLSAICNGLQRIGLTRKRVTLISKEACGYQQYDYMCVLNGIMSRADQLVLMDETGGDDRVMNRVYGYSFKGVRCLGERTFLRGTRHSIIGAYSSDGLFPFLTVSGHVNTDIFLSFFANDVVPTLGPYPGPRSIVILDNARIHQRYALFMLASRVGAIVLFLPPYSPHLNPIELVWGWLKQWIKSHAMDWPDLRFIDLLHAACLSTPVVFANHLATLAHCGYTTHLDPVFVSAHMPYCV